MISRRSLLAGAAGVLVSGPGTPAAWGRSIVAHPSVVAAQQAQQAVLRALMEREGFGVTHPSTWFIRVPDSLWVTAGQGYA